MKHNTQLRFIAITVSCATVAYGLFLLSSILAWQIFPYCEDADKLQRLIIGMWHVIGEKLAQLPFLAVLCFVAARLNHPTGKTAVVTAVVAGLLFQSISVGVFVIRFGFRAFETYNKFFSTMLFTLCFAALFGFLAVWRQYINDKKVV